MSYSCEYLSVRTPANDGLGKYIDIDAAVWSAIKVSLYTRVQDQILTPSYFSVCSY